MTLKKYVIIVQLDSTKEAELVAAKEVYGTVNVNAYTDDLCRHNKVQLTIPERRSWFGAMMRAWSYSRMGILNCIIKV